MTETSYGTTLVRCARPQSRFVDITAFGDKLPVYIETWRGWVIELWDNWKWSE